MGWHRPHATHLASKARPMGGGQPGCPTAPETCTVPSSGGRDIQGCPARGSRRVLPAELATCEHSRSRQRGPGTRQASGRPLPAPGGDPTSVPCLDKAYECLQTYPGAGGCGRADAQPRKGPVRGTVLLSGVRGVKPAALTTGCSIPDSPLQSAPLPTVGCSHICHPLGHYVDIKFNTLIYVEQLV